MQPIRRDLTFDLPPERILDWHGDGPGVTAFINALSVSFPEGERFFIHSVRQFREHITDPELQKAVTAFIGQEAMHGREHENWNEALFKVAPKTRQRNAKITRRVQRWKRRLPRSTQLAMTIGAEHVTAVLGDFMLRNRDFLEGHGAQRSVPGYVSLLRWHGLEETEHKAVAFDVWQVVMAGKPRAYFERCFGLCFMLYAYWDDISALIRTSLEVQDVDKHQEVQTIRHFLHGKDGVFQNLWRPLLRYFKPGFHPWQDDNRELLAQLLEFDDKRAA